MSYPFLKGTNVSLRYAANGNIRSTLSNAAAIFTYHPDWKGKIGFDTFSMRVTKLEDLPSGSKSGVWSDLDCTRAMVWLSDKFGFSLSESATQSVFELIADNHRYSPVFDYFNGLEWDGVPRVDSWLSRYLGVEASPAVEIFQRVVLISAVARTMEPGSKSDAMLVIQGRQGIGKSSAISALVGKEWFSDAPFEPGSKDAYLLMRGKLVIEWSEMAPKKSDINRIRAFLSQTRDEYRPPYGHNVIEVPRQCIFVGTTNSTDYLVDPTGNRRFMPVTATKVDVDAIFSDRDQLWAEAVYMYKSGFPSWFDSDNPDILAAQNAHFDVDPWEEEIVRYLSDLSCVKVHSDALCEVVGLTITSIKRVDYNRIKDIMNRIGWVVCRPYVNGVQRRGFMKVVDSSTDGCQQEVNF